MKVLIVGHYGGENTGDEAMLYGFVNSLNGYKILEIDIITKEVETTYKFDSSIHINFIKPRIFEVLKSIIQCNTIVIGGGTHYHDGYSFGRYLRHLRYLVRYLAIFLLSKIFRKRNCIIANGFGPFQYSFTKFLTKSTLRLIDLITVRDRASYNELLNIGIDKDKLFLTADLAMLLTPTNNVKNQNLLGISITPISKYHKNGAELNKRFIKSVKTALKEVLINNEKLIVKIFIIRGGERESDVGISQDVYNDLIEVFGNERIILEGYHSNPQRTLDLISECGAGFVATRYHSAILAYVAGLNIFFQAYHRKLIDLANDIDLDKRACLFLDNNFKESDIINRVEELVKGDPRFQPVISHNTVKDIAKKNLVYLNTYQGKSKV